MEAAKQCQRTSLPIMETFMTIEEFLAQSFSADLRLLLWEDEEEQRLKSALRQHTDAVKSAILIVGPEGGFTTEEAQRFTETGFQNVSLGPRILRTETAGLVALSILQYEFGDY